MKTIVPVLLAALVFGGCSIHKVSDPALEHMPDPESVQIPVSRPTTAGSLWTERQGGLFNDNKAKQVGDIVTVAIFEQASATKEAKTSTGRDSSLSAGMPNLFGIEGQLANVNSAIDFSKLLSASAGNTFDGTGKTSRKEDLVATLTTQVVEVLPNGNLRIAGQKSVIVNNEQQLVKLMGVVRPADVSAANIVDSKKILDARIAYTGNGVVSDKQSPGPLGRLFDNIWPF